MLKWKDGSPLFALNGKFGELLLLYFGSTYFDDVRTSEFVLAVQLSKQDNEWSVITRWSDFGDSHQKPAVETFISELASALKDHLEFDFSKHRSHWKQDDPEFRCGVVDIIKYKELAIS